MCFGSSVVERWSEEPSVGSSILSRSTSKTPCIKVCRLNKNGVCIGCKRTIEEIKMAYDSADDETPLSTGI